MPDAQRVKNLFRTAAKRYNCVNTVLSWGWDSYWRRTLSSAVVRSGAHKILDVATGSGVLAFAVAEGFERLGRPYQITGVDFCEELLAVARTDAARKKFTYPLQFMAADALALPFADHTFDAVTIGFGLRNFEDRPRAYAEVRRVLRPGGELLVLEFSQPVGLMRPLYHVYDHTLPTIAGWLGQDADAYRYLRDSVRGFPDAPALAQELKEAGFANIRWQRMTGGVVALHRAHSL